MLSFLKRLTSKATSKTIQHPALNPETIHPAARKILTTLHDAGYQAYIVGGSIRDLLLGQEPKDVDIATNAHPEEIKRLFKRRCRIIGRRFKLAHIHFYPEIFEVATFRGQHPKHETVKSEEGMLLRDNQYTEDLREDALRRDFTVNALYYTIVDDTIVDHVSGISDLKQGLIRVIGKPLVRYREDPVRMLRAVRLASKLSFRIEKQSAGAIRKLNHLLSKIPAARLSEEYQKLFLTGHSRDVFEKLTEYDLFKYLFPLTDKMLHQKSQPEIRRLITAALGNTDERISNQKRITPAFLFAVFLWYPYQKEFKMQLKQQDCTSVAEAFAYSAVLNQQCQHLQVPRRYDHMIKDMWHLQRDLETKRRHRISAVVTHPKFRAAYDLLMLRADAGEDVQAAATWWTDFQAENHEGRERMIAALEGLPKRRRRPRRRRRPTNPDATTSAEI